MTFALLSEGSSDRALVPVLEWVIRQVTDAPANVVWVNASRLPPARRLADKVAQALIAQPCDLLFVHRDADRAGFDARSKEIWDACRSQRHVPVVPIRMTEAWLLFDEGSIRAAAGRVSGRHALNLPHVGQLEGLADPKHELRRVLETAEDLSGRRRVRFDPAAALHRVAALTEDWSPLRQLSAFQRLESDTRDALEALGIPLRPRET